MSYENTHDKYDYRFDPDYQARVQANYDKLQKQVITDEETPVVKHKGKLWAAAAAGVAVVTMVTGTHSTLGEGVRAIFPDNSPPVTNPQQLEHQTEDNGGQLPTNQR